MEYSNLQKIPHLVEELVYDGMEQGFKCMVVVVDTLYKTAYYYPFGSVLAAARHITSDPTCMAYRRVVVLSDNNAPHRTKMWAQDIVKTAQQP